MTFVDEAAVIRELIGGLVSEPWGQVSPSPYETGRLVALAPWLAGHSSRLDYLLSAQRPDGGWGAPGGYALVPTLSAAEALLTNLLDQDGRARPDVLHAADHGLRSLFGPLSGLGPEAIPDTPAIDLITTSLIGSINRRLDELRASPSASYAGLGRRFGTARLRAPAGLDGGRLAKVRAALDAGAEVPVKVHHALEVAADAAQGARTISPASTGTVGASPAATAAWLDERTARDPGHPARRFLEDVVARQGGPAPCGIPITAFERSWVLSGLERAGISPDVPAELVESLVTAMGPDGAPAAEGLPPDADTTSVALYALALLGVPRPPDVLWEFDTGAHFCTWPGEDGFSVSVNAHVLEAFGQYLAATSRSDTARYAATVRRLVELLCEHQEPAGDWTDRWHASPYYATACCTAALERFGGAAAPEPIDQARRWVLATQRPDGSWGRWDGSAEETAYALQILLVTAAGRDEPGGLAAAVRRGREFLLNAAGGPGVQATGGPALWHDKDLYMPAAIVRTAVLTALHLAERSITRFAP